jgi:hypothetical protein
VSPANVTDPAPTRSSGNVPIRLEEQMSAPIGDNPPLRDLERTVAAELAAAEGSEPERAVLDTPIGEWLFDPTDVEREEVGLRSLLAAVRTVEGDSRGTPDGP